MKFTKMQGTGNDYVYINCFEETVERPEELAVKVSDRHFGIGSDGLILICPSGQADCRMKMFNADGSESEMCGNGIRCVGKFVYDHHIVEKKEFDVETKAGIKHLKVTDEGGKATLITVDMGIPEVTGDVPEPIVVDGRSYEFIGISMGNPHAVVFVPDVDRLNLEEWGPAFEHHAIFPNRTNTEFVEVENQSTLRMRVWERGSGETMACGTGACAALVAAVLSYRARRIATVKLRGGSLTVRWEESDGHVYMTGPAVTVFEGEWPDT